MRQETLNTSRENHLDTLPAVGKYLTMGPRCRAGIDCPCSKFKVFTSTFSSSRDDCGWDRMEFVVEPILKAKQKFSCVCEGVNEAGFLCGSCRFEISIVQKFANSKKIRQLLMLRWMTMKLEKEVVMNYEDQPQVPASYFGEQRKAKREKVQFLGMFWVRFQL